MRFLPEYFMVAMTSGLMRKRGIGGLRKGQIMKPSLTSLVSMPTMVSRSLRADWRFLQVQETESSVWGHAGWDDQCRKRNRSKCCEL